MGISTSTGTLIAGQSRTFNLSPASAVTLTLSPNVRVTITETPATVAATGLGGNASRVHEPRLPGTFTYGPYPMGGTVVVDVESNSGSSVAWVRSDSIIAESADGSQSLVSGDRNIASNYSAIQGFGAATTIPETVFDQSKGGKYIFTQYDGTYGSYGSALSIATGTLTSMSKTSLQAVTLVSNLKDEAGAAITAGVVLCAWWLSETRFLFVGRKVSNDKHYLWLCNYNGSAWTVGSNSTAFDNGNAVLALGLYSGGQAPLSGILHSRSLAVKSSTEAVIGEYNIASGRVSGGTNDAVRVYRTTDGGATWTAILTFNTSGNQIRHCHFVKYDRYTGDWYMGFGDDPTSAVVRWDGSSTSPAANTPLTRAGIGSTSGWEVMADGIGFKTRSGDISIHPQTAYYMNDNSEANTPTKYAFHVSKSKPMWRVQSNEYERTTGRPPLLTYEMPNGAAFWASMREDTDIGASPETFKGYDFWYTPEGVTFYKIAKTRDNSAITAGAITQMMMTNEGKLVIAGNNSRGCKLLPSASTNGEGSLVLTPGAWDGTVRTLQGTA